MQTGGGKAQRSGGFAPWQEGVLFIVLMAMFIALIVYGMRL